MKTIKFKTLSLFLTITLILGSGCMPDSLTKMKKDPPKKSSSDTTNSGVVTGGDGKPVPVNQIGPTTKFFYGTEGDILQSNFAVGTAVSLSPVFDGSMSDPKLRDSLIVKCEVINSSTGSKRLPAGLTFEGGDATSSSKSCKITGTPTDVTTYLDPATNKFVHMLYTILVSFRNSSGTISTLQNQTKIAVLRAPSNIFYSQTSTLMLGLENVVNFSNFDLSKKIATNKGSIGTLKFKDAQNSQLVITRDNSNKIEIGDLVDNAQTFYNLEAKVKKITNVLLVNERIESTYGTYPASCPIAPAATSKLFVKNPAIDLDAQNMTIFSISPDLPSTAKICNYTDTQTVGDSCYCRIPGEIVGYFDAVTSELTYSVRVFNPLIDPKNGPEAQITLVVSEAPEGVNISQRQLIRVASRTDFEYGETISEQVSPPLDAKSTAIGRVLRSFSLDTDSDGVDEEYIDVELKRGRFRKDSSIDNARYYYSQNTLVLDNPFDYNAAIKLSSTTDFSKGQYVTGFNHNPARRQDSWTPVNAEPEVCDGTKIGLYYDVASSGTTTVNSIGTISKFDKLVCNGVKWIKEPANSFSKGHIAFVDTISNFIYVATMYENYNDYRHPNVTSPFEQKQVIEGGLGLGAWNASMAYYLGTWDASTAPSTTVTCNAGRSLNYYIVNRAGTYNPIGTVVAAGFAEGDRIQCISGTWTKRTSMDIPESPDNSISCSPTGKYATASLDVASQGNINNGAALAALSTTCNFAGQGNYYNVTAATPVAATVDGVTSTFANGDLVMCSFESKWVRVANGSPLRTFIITASSGTISKGDLAYCDSATLKWEKVASGSSTFGRSVADELHSQSQLIKLATTVENFYGRDLTGGDDTDATTRADTTLSSSAYIVHTRKTDSSITNANTARVTFIKGFFDINKHAVAHSEFRSQVGDADYTAASITYPSPASKTNVERVFDDSTFYFETGRFFSYFLTTRKGGAVFYSITPALPKGISFNPTTGELSGTALEAAAIKDYTMVIQNAIGSITYKFKLESLDFFRVEEVNPSIYTGYLHKSGQHQHFRDCKINSRDITTPYNPAGTPDVTPNDITCYFDVGEEDISFFGLKFANSVAGGVCSYVQYEPMSYWSKPPFTTSNFTTNILDRVRVVKSGLCDESGNATVFPGTNIAVKSWIGTSNKPKDKEVICAADYSDSELDESRKGLANCDDGEYDLITYTFIPTGGSTDPCALTINTENVSCGGERLNCLRGPVRDYMGDGKVNKGFLSEVANAANGFKNENYSVKSSISQAYTTNKHLANFNLSNSCQVTDYLYQHNKWAKTYDNTASVEGRRPSGSAAAITSLTSGAGAPVATDCDQISELGTVYQRTGTGAYAEADLHYICIVKDTGYGWSPGVTKWNLYKYIGPNSAFWSWKGRISANPYYNFYCLDSARELKARIRVAVRDWDTEISSRYNGSTYPLRLIDRVDPGTDMDNTGQDTFEHPFNNYDDLDDITDKVVSPSCGASDPFKPATPPFDHHVNY